MPPHVFRVASALGATLALLVGCKNQDTNQSSAPATGLSAPANDARVAALARAALDCPWSDDKGLDETCPALNAWQNAGEVQASSADATLVEMTRDARPQVRWLAGVALAGTEEKDASRDLFRNPAAAKSLADSARRETHPRVGRELGFAVAEIYLADTQLEAVVQDLARTQALPLLRATLVSRVLRHNPTAFEWVAPMARKERDLIVRKAAVSALRFAPADRFEATRALWIEGARGNDAELAEKAASSCAYYEAICSTEWDALLDAIAARGGMAGALWNLFSQPTATAAQRARAQKLARADVDNERLDDTARSLALLFLGDMDPTLGVAVARQYTDSGELALKTSAAMVLAEHADAGAADAATSGIGGKRPAAKPTGQ